MCASHWVFPRPYGPGDQSTPARTDRQDESHVRIRSGMRSGRLSLPRTREGILSVRATSSRFHFPCAHSAISVTAMFALTGTRYRLTEQPCFASLSTKAVAGICFVPCSRKKHDGLQVSSDR
jgi:hypothetical protein